MAVDLRGPWSADISELRYLHGTASPKCLGHATGTHNRAFLVALVGCEPPVPFYSTQSFGDSMASMIHPFQPASSPNLPISFARELRHCNSMESALICPILSTTTLEMCLLHPQGL